MKEQFFINDEGYIVFPQTEERVKARKFLLDTEVNSAKVIAKGFVNTTRVCQISYYSSIIQRSIANITEYEGINT